MSRVVILDCEAVQALTSTRHPHHRRVVAHAQVVADRKQKSKRLTMLVPTSVRVEADLDRTATSSSFFNALRVDDTPLDSPTADVAARYHARHGISVADAHIGATITALVAEDPGCRITVVTSDPGDMRLVAANTKVTIVKL